jgi:hypothetical protein
MIFTIDSIEGNSHIGVPVFSRSAKKSNYNYLVFSPPKGIDIEYHGITDNNANQRADNPNP